MKTGIIGALCKPFILGSLFLILSSSVNAENTLTPDDSDYVVLTLKDNKKVEGTIIERNESILKIRREKGDISVVSASSIIMEKAIPKPKKYFPYFGVTLGTPSGLNLVFGYNINKIGLRISGLYLDQIYGTQFNISYLIENYHHYEHGPTIFASYSRGAGTATSEPFTWMGAGVGYYLNLGGFFIEGGVSWGTGTYSSPQAAIQLGYVYRAN
jgi:hypothetical protein